MGGSYHTTEAQLAGVQVQTSLLGQPFVMGWGRGRISCNLIDYVGFKATPHTQKTGGKGGSSSSTTYTYSASVIMALCEGPVTGVRSVYKDASALKDGATTSLAKAGLSLASGTVTQAAWGYMTSQFPSRALAYSGIAYVYAQDYQLGGQASLPNHGFEVDFAVQFGPNGDADPKDIVTDFLTNGNYGVTGWGGGLIGDLSDYSLYCRANNLLLSPVIDQPITGTDFLRQIFDQTNSEPFWSEGKLKAKSYGDASATANSATWNPDLTPVYALDENDFLEEVELEVIDQSDAYNYVQVEYKDRSNQYQPAVAVAQDLDNIITYGLRKRDPVQFHHICDAAIAQKVAQLLLQRTLYRRDKYTMMLPQDFIGIDPMDYLSITTTVDGMMLANQLVIVESVDEDANGNLQVVAWGVPGTGSVAQYTSHSSDGYQPDPDIAPGNVSAPVLLNAPASMTGLDPEVWIAAGSSDPNWGGCEVWVSADNVTYQNVGTITNPAAIGVLTAALPSASNPDTTNTLSVDMTTSLQVLLSASAANQAGGATMFMVDNEVMTYRTATLTATNKYNLTTLGRGLMGTSPASHASGAKFARIDDAVFQLPYSKLNYGTTMYVKLPSFNIYGRALQDISTLSPYTISLLPNGTAVDWRDVAASDPVLISLSRPTAVLGAFANGGITDFTDANGQLSVSQGGTNKLPDVTLSATGTNCTGTINTADNTPVAGQPKGYYRVTAMTSEVASLDIVVSMAGFSQTISFNLTSIAVGTEIVSTLPTTNLFEGRVVFLSADDKLYRYVGTPGAGGGWTSAVPATDITGQITETQIGDDAITTPKLAANAVTANEIATNAVTTDKLNAGAVTAAKISVTQLSALTATIGVLRTATTGARTEIRDNVIKVYDSSNVLRVQLGDLSL